MGLLGEGVEYVFDGNVGEDVVVVLEVYVDRFEGYGYC